MKTEYQICAVCARLDNNTTLQECKYCNLCEQWICLADIPKLGRRMAAAILPLSLQKQRSVRPAPKFVNEYVEPEYW